MIFKMTLILILILWTTDSLVKLSRCDWNPVCGVRQWRYSLAKAGSLLGVPLIVIVILI